MIYGNSLIDVIGDCPNVETKVTDSMLWTTLATKSGYSCQMNMVTGKARIVSPEGVRKANGSKTAMLEKMRRLASADFFLPGDVIGASRKGIYEHYGIYLGQNRVIHYCGATSDFGEKNYIHEASMEEFVKDSKNLFVVWFDNGRPVKLQKSTSFLFRSGVDIYSDTFQRRRRTVFSPEETIHRAKSRIGEAKYNLATNNCEHFAMWCKTGVSESSQVKYIVGYAGSIGAKCFSLM